MNDENSLNCEKTNERIESKKVSENVNNKKQNSEKRVNYNQILNNQQISR